MSACREVKQWFTRTITKNVYDFAEKAERKCEEARRWVEREIREPIERRRAKQERKCKKRKCKWWCACCNKWFCWLETVIEIFIEWVVKVVGEWLVETVCKLVVKVVKILIDVITTVVRFAVSFFVCITDPRGWLDNIVDLWTDIVGLIGQVGDLLDFIWGAVNELLEITVETLLDLAAKFGPLGFFIAVIAGLLDIIRRFSEHLRQMVEAWIDAIADLLTLNFCGFGIKLGRGAVGLGLGVLDVINILGLGSGKGIEWSNRDQVRETIRNRLINHYGENTDRRDAVMTGINLDSVNYGADWQIAPYWLSVHSRSDGIDLRQMHLDGEINLYDIAGYTFWCADKNKFTGQRWALVYEGGSRKVTYSDIRAYIEEGRNQAPEFELMATTYDRMNGVLKLTRKKYIQLGIDLFWDLPRPYRINDKAFFDMPEASRCSMQGIAEPLMNEIINFTPRGITAYRCSLPQNTRYCNIPFVELFDYETSRFGVASVSFIADQSDIDEQNAEPPAVCRLDDAVPCAPGTGDRYHYAALRHIGATWRSSSPEGIVGLLPAHELGHCFGLRHEGHSGMENIMFTPNASQGLDYVTTSTVITYLLVNTEANFTLGDAGAAWDWILEKAEDCLPTGEILDDDDLDGFF